MTTSPRWLIPGGKLSAMLGLVLLLAGCSSDAGPGPEQHNSQEHHGVPPSPPMVGQDAFFDGKIVAEINVSANGFPDVKAVDGNGDKGGGGTGGGGGGSRHGGGGGGRGGGGRHGGGGGGSPSDSNGEGGGRPDSVRPMMGSTGPALMIHLRFTNQGTEQARLRIDDFSSPLGNFAVQPEVLTLEPGQSLETEPMSSRLAAGLSETDATLVLRLAGRTEKKVISLHALPAATAGK